MGADAGSSTAGPVCALDELDDALCPWCIADGTAADRFDASLADVGFGVPAEVPQGVLEEISRRTPSSSWQQDLWRYQCSDGCEFLGVSGARNSALRGRSGPLRLHVAGHLVPAGLDQPAGCTGRPVWRFGRQRDALRLSARSVRSIDGAAATRSPNMEHPARRPRYGRSPVRCALVVLAGLRFWAYAPGLIRPGLGRPAAHVKRAATIDLAPGTEARGVVTVRATRRRGRGPWRRRYRRGGRSGL